MLQFHSATCFTMWVDEIFIVGEKEKKTWKPSRMNISWKERSAIQQASVEWKISLQMTEAAAAKHCHKDSEMPLLLSTLVPVLLQTQQ